MLTHQQILDLAQEMTDRAQLRHLAMNLGIPYKESMVQERGVSKEAYRMLRSWLWFQSDRNKAHRNLLQALKNANMVKAIPVILATESNFPRLRRITSGTVDHFKAHINSGSQQIVGN